MRELLHRVTTAASAPSGEDRRRRCGRPQPRARARCARRLASRYER